jgi:hypothetical protein
VIAQRGPPAAMLGSQAGYLDESLKCDILVMPRFLRNDVVLMC